MTQLTHCSMCWAEQAPHIWAFRANQGSVAPCPHLAHGPLLSRDARNMARDVQNTFYEIVAEYGNMSQSQATDYVKKLMTKGRYSLDVWS